MEYFLSKRDEFLNFLKQIVEIESPSNSREAVNNVSQYLLKRFQEISVNAKTLDGSPDGDHVFLEYGDGTETVVLLGHMDTVWREGTLKKMPFRIEGDTVYGPGVFDMKSGIVILWFVLRAFNELGLKPNKKLIAIFSSDEEIGSPTAKKYIYEYAKGCKAAIILEPAEEGALKTFRKGLGDIKVRIKGRAAHAGLNPEQGISAIKELAYLTIEAEKLTNYDKGTTVNVGVVNGGTTSNVVPAEAFAEIDFRFSEPAEGEKVEQFFKNYKPAVNGAKFEIEGGIDRGPLLRTKEVVQLFEKAKTIAGELGFELKEIGVGGVSDGNLTSAMGIPTLDGLGAVGAGAHADNEHIDVTESLKRMALVYKLLLEI